MQHFELVHRQLLASWRDETPPGDVMIFDGKKEPGRPRDICGNLEAQWAAGSLEDFTSPFSPDAPVTFCAWSSYCHKEKR